MSEVADRLEGEAWVGRPVEELDTPALVVDLDRMERNIERWQALADESGIRFRPHVKTHKAPEIAQRQLAAGAIGITCAKLAEADVFADAGIGDIVVAYPLFGETKWRHAAALAGRVRLGVNVDSPEGVRGLAAAAEEAGVEIAVYADVDGGLHRGGVDVADAEELARLCDLVQSAAGLRLAGITMHRQLGFAAAGDLTPDDAGRDEGRILVELADELGRRGIDVVEVAGGGSVTGRGFASAPGVTELRAGTYVFCDLMQLDYGVCAEDELALTVLCTVVSTRQPGGATVDGGTKTFTSEGPVRAAGRDVVVERFTEEHGMATVGDDCVELGEKLRFYPRHVCPTVNLGDELIGVRGSEVEVVWPVLARGKRT